MMSWRPSAILEAALLLALGCGKSPASSAPINVGLFLSYTGDLAANSANSERAFIMALEAVNRAGGIEGRPLAMVARDTRSDVRVATPPALSLLNANPALIVGPDTPELSVQVKSLLQTYTVILPSFATSDSDIYKPHSWFVMGASPHRMACELMAQLAADQRAHPVVLIDPRGYNNRLGRAFGYDFGVPQIFLPSDVTADEAALQQIIVPTRDAFILAASANTATSLLYALAGMGALTDARQWYLSPTLHTSALLENLPKTLMAGAKGVASGQAYGGSTFKADFIARWGDVPFDDAYNYYDAGVVAALAMERALITGGAIPDGIGLAAHIVAVTQDGGVKVRWNQVAEGLQLLREGQRISYSGLYGLLAFDETGQTNTVNTTDWTVDGAGHFAEYMPPANDCEASGQP
jgi:ABC-type branched-subunit amino acid transport system substrate-binding protein